MKTPHCDRSEQGAALVVALVLLLVITILGLSSMRGTSLQERMSANLRDRGLAFQAAEAALREAEASLGALAPSDFPPPLEAARLADDVCDNNPCVDGLCSRPDPKCPDRWLSDAAWRNVSAELGAGLGTLVIPPQYFIEHIPADIPSWPGCDREVPMSPNCIMPTNFFRITARSAAAGRSTVILQSTFGPPTN